MRKLIALSFVLACLLAVVSSASAAPAVTGTFDLPEEANRIALGSDGNMWVTLQSTDPNLARVSPDGVVTPFTAKDGVTNVQFPQGITTGPDGNLWLTGTNYVARVSPNAPTVAKITTVVQIGQANDITKAADGTMWTGSQGNVFSVVAGDTPVVNAHPTNVTNFTAKGITVASDGTIWVANGDNGTPGILPMSPAGVAGTQLNAPRGGVQDVAGGPSGQVFYTNPVTRPRTSV